MPDRGVGVGNLRGGGGKGACASNCRQSLTRATRKRLAQKAEVTDAHEAFGQDMQEEAA